MCDVIAFGSSRSCRATLDRQLFARLTLWRDAHVEITGSIGQVREEALICVPHISLPPARRCRNPDRW